MLVYCSSLAAGGPSGGDRPRRESDVDLPVSDYGRSKLEAERALAGFAPAVPITVVRPPIIFGPADRAMLKVFRSVGLFRLHAVPGYRRFPVSLVHVADLCAGMELLAESGVRVPGVGQDGGNAGVYYIAAERWVSYIELGRLAARALGVHVLPVPTPLAAFWITGAVATGVSKITGRPSVLNLDKAREAFGPGLGCAATRRSARWVTARPSPWRCGSRRQPTGIGRRVGSNRGVRCWLSVVRCLWLENRCRGLRRPVGSRLSC